MRVLSVKECIAYEAAFRRERTMLRWASHTLHSAHKAFLDAHTLLEHFGLEAHREALMRAYDPIAIDDLAAKRHWQRVATIIAWRTGQDEYEDLRVSRMPHFSAPLRRS